MKCMEATIASLREEEANTNWPDMLDEISKFVFTSKYARYLEDEKRRETWDEAVSRVEDMHLKKFKQLDPKYLAEIEWAFNKVRDKIVVPSMRSMQFGGAAVEAHNARIYNCAVRHIDSIRSFSEVFYLLLCGCGVGIGLTEKYLSRLPNLVGPGDKTGSVLVYTIEDSIEGWADSIEALLNCYFSGNAYSGRKIVFDYSKIRPAGEKLKTSGGKAPGHEGLKAAHIKIKALLDKIIEQDGYARMRSIDVYDILMHTADAVLSGGVRRSATSVMFEKDDVLMLTAKVGNWHEENPQRGRSNNSVLLIRDELTKQELQQIIDMTREWGEPGFVFAETKDVLYNPCFEVSFIPVDDGVCGVQFCNLTSINGSKIKNGWDYMEAARAATIIGTLQATYTDFPYLGNMAKKLTEDESLLGVSMTAMMDNPDVLCSPTYQKQAATVVKETNARWAGILGINPATRCTVVKPEGSSTLALGSMSSGIHGAHARYMFRRIQMNKLDNVYKFFKQYNPHLCEPSVWSANGTDDVVTFPIVVPEKTVLKADLNAIQHLNIIKSTQQNWIVPGTADHNKKPIHHNVSCTVIVKPEEWEEVIDYLYENKGSFAAVSFISDSGDKDYAQAPNEAVSSDEDWERFESMLKNYIPINYEYMTEETDETSLMQEASCAGNNCEVR
jgi:ribonucleoside-triphosphate reductase